MKKVIKLVTLNVWNGGKLFDKLLLFLKQQDADILVLQEVYNGKDSALQQRFRSFDIFRRELGFQHAIFAPIAEDISSGVNQDVGNATYTKFPIKLHNTSWFDLPYGPFNLANSTDFTKYPSGLLHTAIQIDNTTIDVFNVHGIWGFDGKDNKRRLKMGKTIIEKIKDKKNVVLAGDFNVTPNTETIKNIEKYLDNVFKDEFVSTFNMRYKDNPGYATEVVDMIFVSPLIEVVKQYCPDDDVSDHKPLVVELNI